MEFKDTLKTLRKQAGLTQKELCEKSGVSYSYLTKLESGVQTNPTYEVLAALGGVLGAPLSAVYDFSDIVMPANILPLPKTKKVPLVGTIACGKPILATENIEDEIDSPEDVKADFALRCKGDSMINARINDGDIVFIRQQETVENGEIAAVLLDDEATLKRVYLADGTVTLSAENSKYPPLIFRSDDGVDVRILGKAVAFLSLVE